MTSSVQQSPKSTNELISLPQDTFMKAKKSFLFPFVAGTIIASSLSTGLIWGSMGVLSSLVYAAVRPVFADLARDRGNSTQGEQFVRVFGSCLVAAIPAALFFDYNLILTALVRTFLSTIFNDEGSCLNGKNAYEPLSLAHSKTFYV